VVGRQNADIADTLQLRDVAMVTIFCFLYRRLNRPCAAAMRPYVKLYLDHLLFILIITKGYTGMLFKQTVKL